MPYKEGIWAEKHPELGNILKDNPELPKHNIIKNNVIYKTPDMELDSNVTTYGTVENNIEISDTKGFTDYKNGDFSLTADGEILKKLPDFEIVDYSKIGRYEVTGEDDKFEGDMVKSVKLAIGSDKLYKGEEEVTLDVPAQIIGDRTMVPLRAIFEALGADVLWNAENRSITSTLGDVTIVITIDRKVMYKNGAEVLLDVPAQIVSDRTLVPVRAISESFGYKVDWDAKTHGVTINVID